MFKPILLPLLFCLVHATLQAQMSPGQALRVMDEKYPQEKIHLFFNKEEFVAGETVMFKAYLFSGYVKSLISSTMYVELYDNGGRMVKSTSLPLWNAVGQGSIRLDESLPEGVYHIRAFTRWMLNFDERTQYTSHLIIYNPASPWKLAEKPVNWTAGAYPESGTFLEGGCD